MATNGINLKEDVSTKTAAVTSMSAYWDKASDLMGGTMTMRAAGEKHLPKSEKESDEAYKRRLAQSFLFPAYERTVTTLAAKPFSKEITLGESIPPDIQTLLKDDIDRQGRNVHAFMADILTETLGLGLSGVLVEYPQAAEKPNPARPITVAEEKASGLNPYFVQIHPTQLLGWRAAFEGGKWRFLQLRIMEYVEVPKGEWATETIEQVKVLEPGTWRTYRKAAGPIAEWVLHEEGTTTLSDIPFVPFYGKRRGFMLSDPPLKELAELNIEHWQSSSEQRNILHVARVPILAVTGIDEDIALVIGAQSAIKLPTGSDIKYVEHTGAAIDAGQQSLDKLEEQMRQAGAELLVLAPGKVTATQVMTENAVGMCALQRIVKDAQDGLNLAIAYLCQWKGIPAQGDATIYNDFGAATLAEASADLLLRTSQAGKLSDETLLKEYQRRGMIAADIDVEEELDRVKEQGPPLGALGATGLPGAPKPGVKA